MLGASSSTIARAGRATLHLVKLDETEAECRVFTYKEGALSAIAHDLELDVTRFSIGITGGHRIRASFDPRSLKVLHALVGGRPTSALSDDDKRKIERTIAAHVLTSPILIDFQADENLTEWTGTFVVVGTLTLDGRTRPVRADMHSGNGLITAEATLRQSDFGIKPYRALLGTLRVRDEVTIRVRAPKGRSAPE